MFPQLSSYLYFLTVYFSGGGGHSAKLRASGLHLGLVQLIATCLAGQVLFLGNVELWYVV